MNFCMKNSWQPPASLWHSPATRRGRAQGQALVELALILPLFLLLTVGLVELGRVFLALGAIEAAAYRGATFAAFTRVNALDSTAIRQAVVADWGPFPQSASNPTVTAVIAHEPARTDGLVYDAVTVNVVYAYTPLVQWPGVPVISALQRAVTMRIQP
jgi:Flp pilus assembly protein TadG